MNVNVLLMIASLFYLIFIAILYFPKKKIITFETKIYKYILIFAIFGVIMDLIGVYASLHISDTSIIRWIVLNLYYSYLLTILYLLSSYLFVSSESPKLVKKEKNKFKIFTIVYIACVIINFILPVSYYKEGTIIYAYGPSTDFLYLVAGIVICSWFIYLIINIKMLKTKKSLPMVVFLIMVTPIIYLQMTNPQLLLMSALISFIVVIMYHTIENPDIKLINELNIAKSQAEQANNSKSEFLSSMSHEIRTPLNAILGFSQTLLEKDIKKEEKEDIKDIIIASENLLEIVNGILDISKIEANKLEIIEREYDFKELVKETTSLIKGKLKEKKINYKETIDSEIPQVLYGDSVRIKQIMVNLLTNAVKYTKEGLVEFKINSVIKKNICRLIISVEDTGIGIEKSKLPKLFTKFERMGVEGHTTIEGTGLGLAITKKLIELMGGTIVVQSEYGIGSKFTVAIDQRIVLNPSINIESTISDFTNYDEKFKNKKILIVDDNKLNLKVASKMLESFKVKIDLANSGYECLEKVELGKTYDIILLDDMMPHMTGVETLKKLKQLKDFNTPVVVFTANALTGMKEKYLNDGFDDYLSKPVKKEDLFKVFKNIFKE